MESTVLSVGKSVLDEVLSYAKSVVAEEVALQLGVQGDQAFITDELQMMHAFLNAAHEERDDNKVVKTWVKQVRDVAYDVEDSLQDFAVRLENQSWWRIRTLLDRRDVAKEMKALRAKVEEVSQRNVRYRLIRGAVSKPTTTAEQSTISTEVQLQIAEATRTALQEKKKVDLSKLITEDGNDLRVIAVWGASSDVGVTSIIRAAYDNEDVRQKFQCRAWVRLMHPFSPDAFFTSMVRQFYGHSCEETGKATRGTATGMEVMKKMAAQDNLVDEFNRFVTEERYLVVINGVSTTEDWDWIKTYFPSKNGSRIIVPTQQFEVASFCALSSLTPYQRSIRNGHSIRIFMSSTRRISESASYGVLSTETLLLLQVITKALLGGSPEAAVSLPSPLELNNGKTESSSNGENGSASSVEPCGEEHGKNPTRASTVAAALEQDQLIDRTKARKKVIKLLNQDGYGLIAICGMGGLGKTTLVRGVYEQELGERFQRRAWLTMSRSFKHQEFHEELFRQLRHEDTSKADKLQSDTEPKSGEKKEPAVYKKLSKILSEQNCLIILDDLSSTVECHWILTLLPELAPANRIIVTTRELNIAKHCSLGDEQIYNLELLDDEEAKLLFEKKVFKDIKERENFGHNPDMIEQEKLVLNKCDGLPLAISTVGSFLDTKPKTATEWRNLNKHIRAELETNPELGKIKTVLTSSYEGLPYHLKPPFLYLSIFPEDHDMRWTRLVRRWIAEGYSRRTWNKSAEEIGNSYVTELINRNMVRPSKGVDHRNGNGRIEEHGPTRKRLPIGMPSKKSIAQPWAARRHSNGRIGLLQIHDLIREIGILKSTEENLVFTLEEGCNLNTQGKIRHLAVSRSWTRDKTVFESELDLSHLRSLTVFGKWKSFFISDKMRLLRVLDLEDTVGLRNHHLHQICQLFHLNYLSLRRCDGILRLPNSLGNLKHLQTLDVRDTRIIKLPRKISKLRKLQYLRVGFVPNNDDKERGEFILDWPRCAPFKWWYCCGPCVLACYLLLFITYFLFLIGLFSTVLVKYGFDGLPFFFMIKLDPHGVKFPRGIRKLKALHTLGVINIDGGNAILEDLKYLTELRKLRVTGLNKKNCKKFLSAITKLKCLESLSVQSEGVPGLSGCLEFDDGCLPLENLQSLKLYGNLEKIPKWIKKLTNLVKLELRSSRISQDSADLLGELPNLAILRLWKGSFCHEEVNFKRQVFTSLMELQLHLKGIKSVMLDPGAFPKLEQLQVLDMDRSRNRELSFVGLGSLPSIKEVWLNVSFDRDGFSRKEAEIEAKHMEDKLKGNFRTQLAANSKKPILKIN